MEVGFHSNISVRAAPSHQGAKRETCGLQGHWRSLFLSNANKGTAMGKLVGKGQRGA